MIASVSARPRNIMPWRSPRSSGWRDDALDRLADQVAHADARADRAEARAEAELDGLRGIDEAFIGECHGVLRSSVEGRGRVSAAARSRRRCRCPRASRRCTPAARPRGPTRRGRSTTATGTPMAAMNTFAEQDREAEAHDDQQVPGEHVREEPDAQRDDPQELREHLERDQEAGQQRSRRCRRCRCPAPSVLKYGRTPFARMPSTCEITIVSSVSASVTDRFDVAA